MFVFMFENIPTVCMLVFREVQILRMASRPKRRFVTQFEREILLQQFYGNIEEIEEQFLGHAFVGDEGSDSELVQSSDSEVQADDNNKERSDIADDTENFDDDNIVIGEQEELPRKQKFKNLEEVLDESNYVDLTAQPDLSFSYTDARKTMTINWNTNPENGNIRPRGKENIFKNVPGPRGAAKYVQTPIESFSLFFTDEMVNNIVGYTNDIIRPVLEKFSDVLDASTKYTHFRLVYHMDIQAFLCILYLRAALRVNLMSTSTIWHHESSNDLFSATMSHSRFKFISRFIAFDDKASRAERWKTDKFACMKELVKLMNVGNAKCRYPSPMLSVDESLYPYRGAIAFKQYNPNKPAKYGLLFKSLCDSTTTYTYYTLPYAGKPKFAEGDAAKHYVTGTDAYTQYLVHEISSYSSIQGCNISLDRYFNSVSLQNGFWRKVHDCGYHEA